jgi:hypothetical protein
MSVRPTPFDRHRRRGRIGRGRSHSATALDALRARPDDGPRRSLAAREWGCTLGAVLVWRVVDHAERSGQTDLAAAETGLAAAQPAPRRGSAG